MKMLKISLSVLFSLVSIQSIGQSQYFGQNKPRYKHFDFKVLQSPHFELYHYFDQKASADKLLIDTENWYKLHQEVFKLAFIEPNPIIIYKNHPDFQETTAIGGQIGEGTGGVTEGLRNRVVMPVMYTARQTDHVLGHELVHAFQYQTMTYGSDSTSLASIQNLPLFMVEGLAEYMSIGREDSHTAMWMRDAVLHNDIPSIEDMARKQHKYFPYRWGQAFWAYATATYGDDIIRPLFKETAKYGLPIAFKRVFKKDIEQISIEFKKALTDAYTPLKGASEVEVRGKILAQKSFDGEMNLSPVISPDGKFLAYISSKNVLSIDIFIADATSGKIIRKIKGTSFGGHVDAYNFIETAGSWSPDSKFLAFVIQAKGKNKLSIVNVANGSKHDYSLKGVDAFSNPAWSPDGINIAVSGLVEGRSDLYLFDLKSKKVRKVTDDIYSDIQPAWSADGTTLFFVSDRNGVTARLEKAHLGLSKLSLSDNKIENINLPAGADYLNPVPHPDGKNLYFLSDLDGFRNLYRMDLHSGVLNRLTNYFTGISGITPFSPAISVSNQTGALVYSYFNAGAYTLVRANESEFLSDMVATNQPKIASLLPPFQRQAGRSVVQQNINANGVITRIRSTGFHSKNYKPKFKLDYLANSGLGVSTSQFGTGLGGGISGLFSDMLNANQLAGTVAISGNVQNFGGQFFYLNQARPLQFGASLAHIPYQYYGGYDVEILDTLTQTGGIDIYEGTNSQLVNTLFIDQASVFAFKPFSVSKRIEFGASLSFYSYNLKAYPQFGQFAIDNQGLIRDFVPLENRKPQKLDAKEYGYVPFRLSNIYTALVGDNSTFGTVAPLNGYRYRIQLGQYFGTTSYTDVLADFRKYEYLKPISLAGRLIYHGRLNPTNIHFLNNFNPLFLGYPWYMHGFYGKAYTNQAENISQEALSGEQMAVANFEVRLPFTGPEQLALIPLQILPSDINFFVDAGLVWSQNKEIGQTYEYTIYNNSKLRFISNPIVTMGLSLRVNVLGYLILEPYFALPFYNGGKKPVVSGLNFMIPGW